ncbi:MAG TPA: ATP-binding protein [Thermoanaerobaculia bacterium]|nr:ATP-binding protein [Thermoanaerobaculia bacterium]
MRRFGRSGIVILDCFIEAIRDAGYRGPGAALAELVDNAWEAAASEVHISLRGEPNDLAVVVEDNGHGMLPSVLRLALQFGGTTRFGSRRGLGRYGMGLPAASLSQAQRLDVYSWTAPDKIWWSYLDVQEVQAGGMTTVPCPSLRSPDFRRTLAARPSGTIVVWSRCDRLSCLEPRQLEESLGAELGRVFREQLWAGHTLLLNGKAVKPADPLCLRRGRNLRGAKPYGPTLEFSIEVIDDGGTRRSSKVLVQFVELPVVSWYRMSNEEKRAWGISKSAGISVLRAGREIDTGWFFMGGKRKENYDDWWRCEVRFEPELDHLFGVSHTKQGIRPTEELCRLLTPDMEQIARDLNSRVRSTFLGLKRAKAVGAAVRRARERDHLMEPPHSAVRNRRRGQAPKTGRKGTVGGLSYRIETKDLEEDSFFAPRLRNGVLIVTINRQHAFFDELLAQPAQGRVRQTVELMILAAARAEVRSYGQRAVLTKFRRRWGNALAAFLS